MFIIRTRVRITHSTPAGVPNTALRAAEQARTSANSMSHMTAPRALELAEQANAGLEVVLATADAHSEDSVGEAWHDRRVADVLAHLHAWHVLFEGWLSQARAGMEPAFPAEGYTWEQLEELNYRLYAQHVLEPYATARASLVASHEAMLRTLADCTEAELTAPNAFTWLGGGTLGETAHECLGAHYDWALGVFRSAGLE